MSLYLNKNNDKFKEYKSARIFIDKSNLIKECNSLFGTSDKYMCITRPRRFGKTMALSMLNAYYSKGCDSQSLFDKLNIASDSSYLEHLNKHNVIWIDMASLYTDIRDKNDFLKELETNLLDDLNEAFPNVLKEMDNTISKAIIRINSKLNERFIFLIDEWDVIYREQEYNTKLCDEYTGLLRNLFKSSNVSSCIDLVYMTGILPIRRYSTQSTLKKNYYNNGYDPNLYFYYYRDKEKHEVDLVYTESSELFPIEIKKGISPNHPDKNFAILDKYSIAHEGIVLCMNDTLKPINKRCWLCPIWYI